MLTRTAAFPVPREAGHGEVAYNDPNINDPGVPGVNVPPPAPGAKLRAYVHSHGWFTNNSDTFSDGPKSDISWADEHKVDGYLAAPNGRLKKYSFAEKDPAKKIVAIDKELPYDKDDPASPGQ
jgi:hypothetical protein